MAVLPIAFEIREIMKLYTILLTLLLAFSSQLFANSTEQRAAAQKLYQKGKYLKAYESYKKLLDNTSDHQSGSDLDYAIRSLNFINRAKDTDHLVEDYLKKKPNNFSLHLSAAEYFLNTNHFGTIIDQEFIRNSYQGRRVSSLERDRVRSLQLYAHAEGLIDPSDPFFSNKELGNFYLNYAKAFRQHSRSFFF